jgi:2-iminoacetate synthase
LKNFINEKEVFNLLELNRNKSRSYIKDIIIKSKKLKGLSPKETSALLQCEDKKLINLMFKVARIVKEKIYGKRLVMFAPLYLSNICSNNCLYCGFRKDNKVLKRKILSMQQIKKQVKILEKQGHKRLLLVAAEHPDLSNIDYIEDAIRTVYSTKSDKGEIRRVNVNIAPLSIKDFKRLKATGIGTYQLFQETYHKWTYKKMHPSGNKADYNYRLFAMDRAQKAGIDDVGLGILFGLYDYKFEVLSLLFHCLHLEEKFNVGAHTISVPRIEPALNTPIANNPPYPVSDKDFKKLVAIIRLAVPYTGMILTTREKPSFRDEVFGLGISQISAGSRTNPGAYSEDREHFPESEQFWLNDNRTQLELIKDVIKKGFIPSFCTACYRSMRTGERFMNLAKPGDIQDFCVPNSILTFKEYLIDYGDKELKDKAKVVIRRELRNIKNKKIIDETIKKLKEIEKGKKDIYF